MFEVDVLAGKAVCLLHFLWGWMHPFLPYPCLSCLSISAIQLTLPSPKFLLQKCGSGCCWHTEEPWEAALGALHMAALSEQPAASHMVSTLAHQAPCRWTVQPSSMAWRAETGHWSSQRRKPEQGTRSIAALAMAVAVRQCAAEAQPWNETSGNAIMLSWNLFLSPSDTLLHLPSWRIIF